LVQGDGASVQVNRGVQVAGSGLAGALLQLRLDLPDRVIEVIDQEIEERCQTVGLHFGDDLECRLAPVKLINNLHARHMPLLQMVGRMHTLPCMATELITRDLSATWGEEHKLVFFSTDTCRTMNRSRFLA
jgi:hypothetical protein